MVSLNLKLKYSGVICFCTCKYRGINILKSIGNISQKKLTPTSPIEYTTPVVAMRIELPTFIPTIDKPMLFYFNCLLPKNKSLRF